MWFRVRSSSSTASLSFPFQMGHWGLITFLRALSESESQWTDVWHKECRSIAWLQGLEIRNALWKAKSKLYTAVYTDIHGKKYQYTGSKNKMQVAGVKIDWIYSVYSPIYTKTCLNTTHIQWYTIVVYTGVWERKWVQKRPSSKILIK